jgi:hypothetical protein
MTWQDVTVEEFIEILELQYDDLTPTERILESIAIITGEDYDDVYDDEIDQLVKEYSWLHTNPTSTDALPRYNLLDFGSIISLEQFVTEKPPFQNIDKVCSLLLQYDDFGRGCDIVKGMDVPTPYAMVQGYLDYRKKLFENYDDLFTSDEEEGDDEPDQQDQIQSRWAWTRIVWELTEGDITKANAVLALPHLMVLNWITMVKDLKLGQRTQTVSDNS